jgi:cytochrome c-type biogenesis protein CcmH/NrfG
VNKDFLFGAAVGLCIGLVVALFTFQIGRAGGLLRPPEPVVAAPTGGGGQPMQAGGPAPGELSARIAMASQLTQSDPGNHQAWVALGNAYFDDNQPEKSIEAYARALKLRPDDPDVLTDQGAMYVALHQYARALENFQKANRIAPTHVQSLFNIGVAYAAMNDPARAEDAWNRVIALAPGSDDAAHARHRIEELKAGR